MKRGEITAKILLDSITDGGSRLTTWELTYPRCIHSELLTHGALRRNSASSRAIPAKKLRERTLEAPFVPWEWGTNQKGMIAGAEADADVQAIAETVWRDGLSFASGIHERLERLGLHKQITNRVIEPWMLITVILSGTDFANFFHQRDHRAAEPSMRRLAAAMWDGYTSRMPRYLAPGEWHLPFIDHDTTEAAALKAEIGGYKSMLRKISVGRCARVSYLTHDGKRDISEDIRLHDDLLGTTSSGDPGHFCYDAETEVLTSGGWKLWPDVGVDDVLAESTPSGEVSFCKPTALHASMFNGNLYVVKGQQLDLAVTPNHRMVVSRRRKDGTWTEFSFEEARDVGVAPRRYLKSGVLRVRKPWTNLWGVDPVVWAKFVGFFVGDGYAPKEGGNQAAFHLKLDRKITFLKGIGLPCRALNEYKFVVELPGLGTWLRRNCYDDSSSKKLPAEYLSISKNEFEAICEGLRNSDGSEKRNTWVYSTSSQNLADEIQALMHLNGKVMSRTTTEHTNPEHKTGIRLNVSDRSMPRVEINQQGRSRTYEVSAMPYTGIVYCATTSSGALVVRRNGHVVISGNSPFEHPAQAVGGRQRIGPFEGFKQYRKFLPGEAGPDTSVRCERCGLWAGKHVTSCPNQRTP